MIYEKRESLEDKIFDIVVFAMLAIFTFIILYPVIIVVSASISDPNFVNRGEVLLFPKGLQFESYKLVLKDARFISGYYNSVYYTVFGTLLSVGITVMAAFPLSRTEMIGHKFITWFFLLTMYINGGLIPTYIQVVNLRLVGTRMAIIVVGCLSIWNLIVCRTFMQNSIPYELWEAASIDGCSIKKYFFRIVLPNSKTIIAILVLYYAVAQWNEFFKALIYLNDSKLYPLQLVMREILLASQSVNIDASPELYEKLTKQAESMKYAMIIISSLPVLCIYPFIQKYFVKGIMVGSVKG